MTTHLHFRLLLLLLLRLLLLFDTFPSRSLSPEHEALLSLKSSISNDPSNSLATWIPSSDHCQWSYVKCSPQKPQPSSSSSSSSPNTSRTVIISLDLSNLNLTGTLHPDVGLLKSLQHLSVSGNSFSGEIPAALSLLTNLRSLNLSNNLFNYTFPAYALSSLTLLTTLDLYNNNLIGPLSTSLTNFTKLSHLNLGCNYFSGTIPFLYGSSFLYVKYLDMSGNDLTGQVPPSLGNLTALEQLYLGYSNTFSGPIPPEFGNLTQLIRFDAADCGLSGPIPPELGKLKNLNTLSLQYNTLSGLIPWELGTLNFLKWMDLASNLLEGEIPTSFNVLTNLQLLSLSKNRLHGNIPVFIGDLPELEVLQLRENNFSGTVPERLGNNGKLKLLDISYNNITGTLPPRLCSENDSKLETLISERNSLFGEIPESLGKCESLIRIRMGDNLHNGSVPKGLLGLPKLNIVELENNFLTGSFPDISAENKTNKTVVVYVQELLLHGNQFSSEIPAEIGTLHHLSRIDLSNNHFSGEIPSEMSKCKQLSLIDLSRNELSGEIPMALMSMKSLNYLNLSGNHLSGSIPEPIAGNQGLTSVDFSYNNLSGSVEPFSHLNYTSFSGNPGLCGLYLAPCKIIRSSGGALVKKLLLVIGVPVCIFGFVIIALAVFAIIKCRSSHRKVGESDTHRWKLTSFQHPPLDLSQEDVRECLKDENIIGQGAAGTVYRCLQQNGRQVALKVLPQMQEESMRGSGFESEIETLGRARHRQIVPLFGFCSYQETNILVYEYMAHGSLYSQLYEGAGAPLNCHDRYKIAVQVGGGLSYLHHDCQPYIVHCDVKSHNILLDSKDDAFLADFGLAKVLEDRSAVITSMLAGTLGYIAPEYFETRRYDRKCDVYSFGVLLLELITGRRPLGNFENAVGIVDWVRKTTAGIAGEEGVIKILDRELILDDSDHQHYMMVHMFDVAVLCVQREEKERPTMKEVFEKLSNLKQGASDGGASESPNAPLNLQSEDNCSQVSRLSSMSSFKRSMSRKLSSTYASLIRAAQLSGSVPQTG